MKILFTNIHLVDFGGTEVYIREVAKALKDLNHDVEVYSPKLGKVSDQLKGYGINVVDNLSDLKNIPDIIHGHHHDALLPIIDQFSAPVINFCHARYLKEEEPLLSDKVVKYVAVDNFCMERLLENPNIDKSKILIIRNWVNTHRFRQKPVVSTRPLKALIFGKVTKDNYYNEVAAACHLENIEVTAIGNDIGNPIAKPEDVLGDYDIVFAKAKCAMEAMACGCAVIMCDYAGLGHLVTPQNFSYARKYNFGLKNLYRPHDTSLIIEEIKKYDSQKVKEVSNLIHEKNNFERQFAQLISLYESCLVSC